MMCLGIVGLEHEEVVVGTLKRYEVSHDFSIHRKGFADARDGIPALPYLPIVLSVKNMLLGERNLECEPKLRQKRNLKRKGEHRPEVRHAYDDTPVCNATKLGDCTVKLLKR